MTRGKNVCKILKEIRQQIADKNEIEYITSECHFRGECKGTCPKCEAEIKYLEDELHKRRLLGKAASIAGISLGIAGSFTACNAAPQQQADTPICEQKTVPVDMDTILPDTVPNLPELRTTIKGFVPPILEGDVEKGEVEVNDTIEKKIDDEEQFYLMGAMEALPQFPGGDKELINFIQKNLVYPKEAEEKRIEGRVIVSFVVEKDGSLIDIAILKGVDPALDAEALRVVKMMPKWKAGMQNGKLAGIKYTFPIRFKLNDEKGK